MLEVQVEDGGGDAADLVGFCGTFFDRMGYCQGCKEGKDSKQLRKHVDCYLKFKFGGYEQRCGV